MAPVGMTAGGVGATLLGQPELAPAAAAAGGAAGTAADQALNRHYKTGFAPHSATQALMGEAGNAALGAGSEVIPQWLMTALGHAIGPAVYKLALHVSPSLAKEFPKVNIPQEAWDQGAPRLNAESVDPTVSPVTGMPVGEATAEIARRSQRMNDMFRVAETQGAIHPVDVSAVSGQRGAVPSLISDLGRNLQGAADQGEARTIISDWVDKNQGTDTLRDLYELAQRAGNSARSTVWNPMGGTKAAEAVSPNAQLVGKSLNRDIVDYIENLMNHGGAPGASGTDFRDALAHTQKAIAVKSAVEDASKVGAPRLNAENVGKQAKWGAFQSPQTLGDVGRYLGGKTTELPPSSRLARTLLRTGPAAARTLATASRFVPMSAQESDSTAARRLARHRMKRGASGR